MKTARVVRLRPELFFVKKPRRSLSHCSFKSDNRMKQALLSRLGLGSTFVFRLPVSLSLSGDDLNAFLPLRNVMLCFVQDLFPCCLHGIL